MATSFAMANALEQGSLQRWWARPLEHVWRLGSEKLVRRKLNWPAHLRAVVAIGGATLGGSGKTPLAIACAGELAAAGARTTLIGHAYRATPGRARTVTPSDRLEEVGDEALLAAQMLQTCGARVVVAPTRQEAISFAALEAEVIVLDGIGQTAPKLASLALLAVDAAEPWGRMGAMPPRGDLRAPRSALLAACDAVVPIVQQTPSEHGAKAAPGHDFRLTTREPGVSIPSTPWSVAPETSPRTSGGADVWPAALISRGVWLNEDTLLTWSSLRSMRIGLFTALGRPHRLVRFLEARGLPPRKVVQCRDHGPFGASALQHLQGADVDLWLASPKCSLHVRNAGLDKERAVGGRLGILEGSLTLAPVARVRLKTLAMP